MHLAVYLSDVQNDPILVTTNCTLYCKTSPTTDITTSSNYSTYTIIIMFLVYVLITCMSCCLSPIWPIVLHFLTTTFHFEITFLSHILFYMNQKLQKYLKRFCMYTNAWKLTLVLHMNNIFLSLQHTIFFFCHKLVMYNWNKLL